MIPRIASAALLAGFAFAGFVVGASPALACGCAAPDDAAAFDMADVVFIGAVERIHPARAGADRDADVVLFRVSDVYKGNAVEVQAIVVPPTDCRPEPFDGSPYLVFASATSDSVDLVDGFYALDDCGGTRSITENDLGFEASAGAPDPGGPPSTAAIREQLGDPRSSIVPEMLIFVGVLAAIFGLTALLSRRWKRANARA